MTFSETWSSVCTVTHDNISHHYTKLMHVGWRSSLYKNITFLSSILRLILYIVADECSEITTKKTPVTIHLRFNE
jgi:hypothetical protein